MDLEKLRENFIKNDFIPYQSIDAGWFLTNVLRRIKN